MVDGEVASLSHAEQRRLRALLVHTVAAADDPRRRAAVSEAVRDAPIAALPWAADLHRVSGTVLRGLEGVGSVPKTVTDLLTAQRNTISLHHLLFVAELGRVGSELDRADVSWVAMKGPVLAALFYPSVGDRRYVDLDILVARRDFPTALAVVEALGYRDDIKSWRFAEDRLIGEIALRREAVTIDLHWHLHYSRRDRRPFRLVPESLLERRRSADISGVRCPVLDPVDQVLTLAFHAARSGGHKLVWMKDIERALAGGDVDADELVARSRQARCAGPVGLMLQRSAQLLGANVPPQTVDALTSWPLRATASAVAAVSSPVPLHDRDTATRIVSRSARSSDLATLAAVPGRVIERVRRRFERTVDDGGADDAKSSYLDAVRSAPRIEAASRRLSARLPRQGPPQLR